MKDPSSRKREVVIALDFPTMGEVLGFLDLFKGKSLFVKIGMELFYQNGPILLEKIKALGHKIFLDLKLHDIPNTVYSATKGLLRYKIDILTVHASGGSNMMAAAKRAVIEEGADTKIIAITQLTSTSEIQMQREQNIATTIEESVSRYAMLAKNSGIDGVVCSVWETNKVKRDNGGEFIVVNPGIRFFNDDNNDQKRVADPKEAKNNGADIIVVGRSITGQDDPLTRYEEICNIFKF